MNIPFLDIRTPTKWSTICRRFLEMYFLRFKLWCFDFIFIEVSSYEYYWQEERICSGNVLAPSSRKSLTWTYDDPVYWSIYVSPCLNMLAIWACPDCKPQDRWRTLKTASITSIFILTHRDRGKWPPFTRRHFQMHLLEWKCINFD